MSDDRILLRATEIRKNIVFSRPMGDWAKTRSYTTGIVKVVLILKISWLLSQRKLD